MLLTMVLYTVRTGIIEPHARTLEFSLLVRCTNRWLSYGGNREFTGEFPGLLLLMTVVFCHWVVGHEGKRCIRYE